MQQNFVLEFEQHTSFTFQTTHLNHKGGKMQDALIIIHVRLCCQRPHCYRGYENVCEFHSSAAPKLSSFILVLIYLLSANFSTSLQSHQFLRVAELMRNDIAKSQIKIYYRTLKTEHSAQTVEESNCLYLQVGKYI